MMGYTGIKKEYHNNKQVAFETPYVNGEIHGTQRFYSANGRLTEEMPYEHGKRHGKHMYWSSTNYDRWRLEMDYVHGKKHGFHRWFDSNGNIREEKIYVDDKRHGYLKIWDGSGHLTHFSVWNHGAESFSMVSHRKINLPFTKEQFKEIAKTSSFW